MIIYLAGESYGEYVFNSVNYDFNRLDSFFYCPKASWLKTGHKKFKRYILDSGAFTFIMNKQAFKKFDIDDYTNMYIDWINANDIQLFFEMDVDAVFGYQKVLALRNRIEAKTGKQCIPVFHKSRGKEDWVAMCKDYKYISIGMAGKDVAWGDSKTFKLFVENAMQYGTKVHGLGITGEKSLRQVPFHSVDSSAWTSGNRHLGYFLFNGMYPKRFTPSKSRIKNHKALALHNFNEWLKFCDYMEDKLTI